MKGMFLSSHVIYHESVTYVTDVGPGYIGNRAIGEFLTQLGRLA